MKDNELGPPTARILPTELSLPDLLPGTDSLGSDLNRIHRSESWRVLDTRNSPAFRNGHVPGSIHLDAGRWPQLLYLLPPRRRRLCVLGTSRAEARTQAERLLQMGWKTVGFATVPPSGLPPQSRATGPSDTILWEPSPWLRQVAADLPATGAGLDLACGSGRNTVYLAWTRSQSRKDSPDAAASSGTSSAAGSRAGPRASSTVYGVDILPDALDQARQLRQDARRAAAARRPAAEVRAKLEARFHQADMSSHEALRRWLPAGKWSVVVVLRYLDREILPAIADSLEPGGHLVYQTFLEEQRIRKGSPRNDRHLLRPGELRKAFGSLEPLRYEEGEDDEGNVLASLWARRP